MSLVESLLKTFEFENLQSLKEKRDLRSQFLGRGVDTNSLPTFRPPKLTLVIYFDLSQILVSSDTQLLSKPEIMTHPQSLLGLSTA